LRLPLLPYRLLPLRPSNSVVPCPRAPRALRRLRQPRWQEATHSQPRLLGQILLRCTAGRHLGLRRFVAPVPVAASSSLEVVATGKKGPFRPNPSLARHWPPPRPPSRCHSRDNRPPPTRLRSSQRGRRGFPSQILL
ncbi:50S ribosomal protein L35, partial [Zea mays]